MLTTEFAAFELSAFQALPQLLLCVRGRIAKSPWKIAFQDLMVGLAFHFRCVRRKPIPTQPSP
jgi:hypothetical protein